MLNQNNSFSPCGERAFSLWKSYEEKLLESLSYLIDFLKEDFPSETSSILPILNSKQFSPFWGGLNKNLISAIETQDEKEVLKLLKEFKDLSSSFFLNYGTLSPLQKQLFLEGSCFELPQEEDMKGCSPETFSHTQTLIREALDLLQDHRPDLRKEVDALLKGCLILESSFIEAGSARSLLGLVHFRSSRFGDSPVRYVDLLVHECAHQYLYHLQLQDPLVCNPLSERYTSPLRKDPRPMNGIFHAFFVLTRLTYALKGLKDAEPLLRRYKDKTAGSIETIEKHAHFTDQGRTIFKECKDFLKQAA